ncbi:MAG: hypothetical protein IJH37_08920 [Clostridia bacterium]|nr:hypothetical protein [Clostridia bacterium]
MKNYTTPKMELIGFSNESVLTASGTTQSEREVKRQLTESGASTIKSVSWDEMW